MQKKDNFSISANEIGTKVNFPLHNIIYLEHLEKIRSLN